MPTIHSKEYRDIVTRLKIARKEVNLRQEVARLLNKPQSYLSKIETFQRRMDILELKKLCEIFKIDPKDIL